MNNKKASMMADIAYMTLFILLFVCVAFIVFSEDVAFNVAALCIMFAVLIISHFTVITFGLIINVVIIFAGFSWYLYQAIFYGTPIRTDFYFWAVVGPVLTLVSNIVFRNVVQIEEENSKLKKQLRHFSIIDDMTNLKNIQAYEMEFPIYQRISSRYEIGMMLIVWQFRYADDLHKMLGKTGMEQTAIELSRAMSVNFRKEDVIYIMSKEPYEWGSLLLTNENSEELLRKRVRKSMEEMDFTDILGKNAPRLEIRMGIHFAESENETALSMLEKAKNKLQYDV